jgi:UDP-N-acetylmuramate: L-alanyl-gamma-D-glutamyl-meso-diaminopimelate ligase
MNLHFIAIGGSIMHNLAISLRNKGYNVTGSDDQIYDPAASKLKKYGIFPNEAGWHPERIHNKLDAVILGMHARKDNPELIKAKELGLKIYSFPEYVFEQSKDKKRVVIGGSHGKTSTTSMIMYVLTTVGLSFDYLVGSELEGFELMVQLTDAPIIIIEGDCFL